MKKKGQQEIAGFVLIVLLVVVALVIFLVISARKTPVQANSKNMDNLLTSLMEYTTECVVAEPYYENVRDLVESCYNNRQCKNNNMLACDFLKESLTSIMADLMLTEPLVSGYELQGYWENEDEMQNLFVVKGGDCNQSSNLFSAHPEKIGVRDGEIIVELKVCIDG